MKIIVFTLLIMLINPEIYCQDMNNEAYVGKRVLTIGASKKILKKFTSELNSQEFTASFSNAYEYPNKVFQEFNGSDFDVIAMGRGVSETNKNVLLTRFKEQNPKIVIVEGFAPITNLFVDQIKLACLPGDYGSLIIKSSFEGIQIFLTSECRLKVKSYHINWLYMSKEKDLLNEKKSIGTFSNPLKMKKNTFIVISQNEVVTNIIKY